VQLDFDNVAISSIFLEALFHLTLLIFLVFMLIGEYKDQLGLFYGPTRLRSFSHDIKSLGDKDALEEHICSLLGPKFDKNG
jgi:hypothetical protein